MSAQAFPPPVTAHAPVLLLDPDSGRNQGQYSQKLNYCEDKDTPEALSVYCIHVLPRWAV